MDLFINWLATVVIARYALQNSEQCVQMVVIFAIGSVVVGTPALLTCSLPVMRAFALYAAGYFVVNQIAKKE